MEVAVIHEGRISIVLVDNVVDFFTEYTDKVAAIKLAALEEYIERIRIDSLPETPGTTNCTVRNLCTAKAPIGRGRGPPIA